MRGQGSTNVRVPQGSPLSPVAFLIWMAPILQKIEERVKVGIDLDMEIPSFIDDIYMDIIDREGDNDISMQRVEVEVTRIV